MPYSWARSIFYPSDTIVDAAGAMNQPKKRWRQKHNSFKRKKSYEKKDPRRETKRSYIIEMEGPRRKKITGTNKVSREGHFKAYLSTLALAFIGSYLVVVGIIYDQWNLATSNYLNPPFLRFRSGPLVLFFSSFLVLTGSLSPVVARGGPTVTLESSCQTYFFATSFTLVRFLSCFFLLCM